jgi:hypothetical protein
MARPKNNLNSKSSEYIEENFLSPTPEGLETRATVPHDGELVVSGYIPEMRKVQFVNGRDPGQELMFHYHSETHPLKHYTLFHGKEYTLPVEIIEHLENCSIPVYAYRTSPESGLPEMFTKSQKYLYQLKSVKQRAA